jgi:hypothetical protein
MFDQAGVVGVTETSSFMSMLGKFLYLLLVVIVCCCCWMSGGVRFGFRRLTPRTSFHGVWLVSFGLSSSS